MLESEPLKDSSLSISDLRGVFFSLVLSENLQIISDEKEEENEAERERKRESEEEEEKERRVSERERVRSKKERRGRERARRERGDSEEGDGEWEGGRVREGEEKGPLNVLIETLIDYCVSLTHPSRVFMENKPRTKVLSLSLSYSHSLTSSLTHNLIHTRLYTFPLSTPSIHSLSLSLPLNILSLSPPSLHSYPKSTRYILERWTTQPPL